jgi:hypothetical protein
MTSIQSYQPLDAINFDFNEFRHEISKFRLPGQKFTFRSREYTFSFTFITRLLNCERTCCKDI